ncbi:MAG: hypothetical protein AAGA54_27910 [Myxococcota bacterium]
MAGRLLASVLAVLCASSPVHAAGPADDEEKGRAATLVEQGRHLEAARDLEAEFERSGDPLFLFAAATARRRGGDCRGAIALYERFLESEPPPPTSDAAEAGNAIEECRSVIGEARAEPEPPPPVLVVAPSVDAPRDTAAVPEQPWTRDVLGGALLGSGVAVAVGGAIVVGVGAALARPREESEAGFERREQSVRTLYAAGGSMLAAGGALLIGSIVRYAVVARRSRDATARLRVR